MHLRAFLAIVLVMTVVPGPDTALVVRNAVRRGRRAGLLTALGCTLGLAVWALAAAGGMTAALRLSASLFAVVRLAGAIYLAVLGARFLVAGYRTAFGQTLPRDSLSSVPTGDQQQDQRRAVGTLVKGRTSNALLEGLLADLLNPKAAAFFTALLPQFVLPERPAASAFALGMLAAIGALIGFAAYALLAAQAGAVLRRRWPAAIIDALTGVVLLVLGITLLHESPPLRRRLSARTP